MSERKFRIINHSFTPAWKCWNQKKKTRRVPMSAPTANVAELIGTIETPKISCRSTAAQALTMVRDGVITGEGPTTRGRVHFSRALDAADAAWCARILTASAVEHQPVQPG